MRHRRGRQWRTTYGEVMEVRTRRGQRPETIYWYIAGGGVTEPWSHEARERLVVDDYILVLVHTVQSRC